jgi:hypothetical protein
MYQYYYEDFAIHRLNISEITFQLETRISGRSCSTRADICFGLSPLRVPIVLKKTIRKVGAKNS